MLIREFEFDDYPQVIALWKAAGLKIGRSDSLESIRKKLERDADLFLVAEEGGCIVGAIMGCFDGRRGWLNHLAVAPELQKKGMGRLIIDHVEERLKARGCEKINLLIAPANSRVQGFYERLGYIRDELIFMEKWLE